jgi:hypothetical protein
MIRSATDLLCTLGCLILATDLFGQVLIIGLI